MFLLNLSLAEFLTLFGAVSGIVVALYLLDRSRRRVVVATLRFWTPAEQPPEARHRRHIRQPLSLLLQLISLLLLFLAVAQLRLGTRDLASRDHVIVIDCSSWMSARGPRGTLMEEARALARAYLRRLPATDRVMLVRADALATPATGFETDRKALEEAIRQSAAGPSALDIGQALAFARRTLELQARRPGEIVYAGAGRIKQEGSGAEAVPRLANLRLLPVNEVTDNCGLRRVSLRRAPGDAELWEIFAAVRNYGLRERHAPLGAYFGGAPVAAADLSIAPGKEQNTRLEFRTRAAGWLELRLGGKDALAADDRAVIELPARKTLEVAVFSENPELLRPLIAANPWIRASYYSPAAYKPDAQAQVFVLDRFRPASLPKANTVWIQPPAGAAPVREVKTAAGAALRGWNSEHALGAGLRTKDLRLENTRVYATGPGRAPVLEVEGGAAIVALAGPPKAVVFGFHPGQSAMLFELAAPLLMANLFRWFEPELFRQAELTGESAGTIEVALDAPSDPAVVRVLGDGGTPLPFTLDGRVVRFFGGGQDTVRVIAGEKEFVYSLTLPEIADAKWEVPEGARRGIPRLASSGISSRDIWHWLALAGGLGLLAEWLLFGRAKIPFARAAGFKAMLPRFLRRRAAAPLRRAS